MIENQVGKRAQPHQRFVGSELLACGAMIQYGGNAGFSGAECAHAHGWLETTRANVAKMRASFMLFPRSTRVL